MQFDESPNLDQFKDGMPENKKMPDPQVGRRRFRILLLIIFIIVTLIGLVPIFKENNTLATLTSTAVVRGPCGGCKRTAIQQRDIYPRHRPQNTN